MCQDQVKNYSEDSQKSNMKQEEEEGSSLKLDLEVQQKGNEMGIKPINKIYNEKFKQFVYYCWIQHSLMPNSTPPCLKKTKHHIVHVNCYFNFIPTTCMDTRFQYDMWKLCKLLHFNLF
jgi:hypothetical protein